MTARADRRGGGGCAGKGNPVRKSQQSGRPSLVRHELHSTGADATVGLCSYFAENRKERVLEDPFLPSPHSLTHSLSLTLSPLLPLSLPFTGPARSISGPISFFPRRSIFFKYFCVNYNVRYLQIYSILLYTSNSPLHCLTVLKRMLCDIFMKTKYLKTNYIYKHSQHSGTLC
jgi:hypothetical protein